MFNRLYDSDLKSRKNLRPIPLVASSSSNPISSITVNWNQPLNAQCPEDIVKSIKDSMMQLCELKDCLRNDLHNGKSSLQQKMTLLDKLNCCLEFNEDRGCGAEPLPDVPGFEDCCEEMDKEKVTTEIIQHGIDNSKKCELIRALKVKVARLKKVQELELCLAKIKQQKEEACQDVASQREEVRKIEALISEPVIPNVESSADPCNAIPGSKDHQ